MYKFVIFTVIIGPWGAEALPIIRDILDQSDIVERQNMDSSYYVIPREAKPFDIIALEIDLNPQPSSVIVKLTGADSTGAPDLSNIVWQKNVDFKSNKIIFSTNKNGVVTDTVNQVAADCYKLERSLTLTIFMEDTYITGLIGNANLDDVSLEHNLADIRFLLISGDIEKVKSLNFNYEHKI